MAPQRRPRGCLTANRQDDRAAVANEAPKPRKKLPGARVLQRQQRNEANVEEWVYRFLGNLAAIEQNKHKPRKRTTTFRLNNRSQKREVSKTEALRRLRSPTPYAWDRTSPRSVADALRHPVDRDYDDDEDTSPPISLPMVTINPKARAEDVVPPLPDAPVSDAMELQDDENRTLLQKINRYIKAGIAEGKRRAKRYVRKALSFAIEMGYLVPADSEGKLLRVSAALVNAPRTDAAKSTKKQRQAATTSSGRVQRRRTTRRKPHRRASSTRQGRNRRRSKHPRVKRRGQGDDVYDEGAAAKRRDSGSDENDEDGTRNSRPNGADDELEKSSDSASKTAEEQPSRTSLRSGGRQSGIPETMSPRLDSDEAMDCKPSLSLLQQQSQQLPAVMIGAVRPRTSASQRSGHQRDIADGQR